MMFGVFLQKLLQDEPASFGIILFPILNFSFSFFLKQKKTITNYYRPSEPSIIYFSVMSKECVYLI